MRIVRRTGVVTAIDEAKGEATIRMDSAGRSRRGETWTRSLGQLKPA